VILSAIVAASDNNVIGINGQIPWQIPGEQARVKETTMGQPLIMGRVTHESIGRTLPGRLNLVISRQPDYRPAAGSIRVGSLDEALGLPEVKASSEAFVFGGQAIYEAAMPRLDRIYLTRVHVNIKGDKFFEYDPQQWRQISIEKHSKSAKASYDYDYILLERQK
jgi:dihydrofolate reductase